MYCMFLMTLLIFLACSSQICISGRTWGMNEVHGYIFMVLRFMHGIQISSSYVSQNMVDLFGLMSAL